MGKLWEMFFGILLKFISFSFCFCFLLVFFKKISKFRQIFFYVRVFFIFGLCLLYFSFVELFWSAGLRIRTIVHSFGHCGALPHPSDVAASQYCYFGFDACDILTRFLQQQLPFNLEFKPFCQNTSLSDRSVSFVDHNPKNKLFIFLVVAFHFLHMLFSFVV